jgi:hypothetical protein
MPTVLVSKTNVNEQYFSQGRNDKGDYPVVGAINNKTVIPKSEIGNYYFYEVNGGSKSRKRLSRKSKGKKSYRKKKYSKIKKSRRFRRSIRSRR